MPSCITLTFSVTYLSAKSLKEKEQEEVNMHVRLSSSDEKGFYYNRNYLFCERSAHVGTKRKSSEWIA